ncbi:flagellar hook-basal body complex protein [Erythrobacter sp. W53]|uniref:flagellar hook-basal body complex protein n=1 Tax=Erythrobacter sp. W53 TaxID=3425947 RepID=UPI003D769805
MGLHETAAATLLGGERRIETAARNVTNANTPGYKREIAYSEIAEPNTSNNMPSNAVPTVSSTTMANQGVLLDTGNLLDVAINGPGLMLVRDGERFAFSRGGNLGIGNEGILVDALGRAVQRAGGGDLELTNAAVEILADGTVLDGDVPIGTIGMFEAGDLDTKSSISATRRDALLVADASEFKQGMIERSNVTLSDEMVELMRTQRQVESGAQLVRAYDQLMSQAISTFSRSGS